jgi:hypothetical protein
MDQATFQSLVDCWTKATWCLKEGNATQSKNNSQMSMPWRDVCTSQQFIRWATGQLANFYPGIYLIGGAPPAPEGSPLLLGSQQQLWLKPFHKE